MSHLFFTILVFHNIFYTFLHLYLYLYKHSLADVKIYINRNIQLKITLEIMRNLFNDILSLVECLCIVVFYAAIFILVYAAAVYYLDSLIYLLIKMGMDVRGKMFEVAKIIDNQQYPPNYV